MHWLYLGKGGSVVNLWWQRESGGLKFLVLPGEGECNVLLLPVERGEGYPMF